MARVSYGLYSSPVIKSGPKVAQLQMRVTMAARAVAFATKADAF